MGIVLSIIGLIDIIILIVINCSGEENDLE